MFKKGHGKISKGGKKDMKAAKIRAKGRQFNKFAKGVTKDIKKATPINAGLALRMGKGKK